MLYVLLPIMVVLFGNYIIMNLFISILLQSFAEEAAEEDLEDEDEAELWSPVGDRRQTKPKTNAEKTLAAFARLLGQEKAKVIPESDTGDSSARPRLFEQQDSLELDRIKEEELQARIEEKGMEEAPAVEAVVCGRRVHVHMPQHNALGLLGPQSPIRLSLAFLVHHPYFDNFIIACILASSALLIWEQPYDWIVGSASNCPAEGLDCSAAALGGQNFVINCERGTPEFGKVFGPCGSPEENACCETVRKNQVLQALDWVFVVVFVAEMCLKIVSDGLILHRFAYFRVSWNLLDFFIVVISIISATSSPDSGGNVGTLKALRAIRSLRPLRVIKRFPGLRVIVVSFLSCLSDVFQTAALVALWFVFFGMIGVNFFKGKFYACYDPQNQIYYGNSYNQPGPLYKPPPPLAGPGSVPTIIECVGAGGGGLAVWQNKPYSFDTLWEAVMTLFQMCTTEGWVEMIASTMDVVDREGVTPLPNWNNLLGLYCVVHIFIGTFVLLNLIVGTVIANYIKIKNREDGLDEETADQQVSVCACACAFV